MSMPGALSFNTRQKRVTAIKLEPYLAAQTLPLHRAGIDLKQSRLLFVPYLAMTPLFERIPYDILLNITFLSASDAVCRAPTELLNLRLTCKTLHRYLDVRTSAHLYARLFRCHFDLAPLLSNSPVTSVNDATLANEYVLRQQFLARSRTSAWTPRTLASDMLVALRMLLESCGLNDQQLASANFSRELLELARVHIRPSDDSLGEGYDSRGLKWIIIWLLCLSLSKSDIANLAPAVRDNMCKLLFFYMSTSIKNVGPSSVTSFFDLRYKAPPSWGGIITSASGGQGRDDQQHHRDHAEEPVESTLYARQEIPVESELNPAFAAVNVFLALRESSPLVIPPHLPEDRAAATLRRVSGPTKEDFRVFQNYQTPLFADRRLRDVRSRETSGVAREASQVAAGRGGPPCRMHRDLCWSHHPEFSTMYQITDSSHPRVGRFSGLWQGSYMTHTADETGAEYYTNRNPLQVAFTEYHCLSPNVPLPSPQDSSEMAALPTRPWDFDHPAQRHRYERLDSAETSPGTSVEQEPTPPSTYAVSQFSGPVAEQSSSSKSDGGHDAGGACSTAEVLDTILFGETTADHDSAWKGFRYVGRIREDRMVILKREPKNPSEAYLGTWVFEGRLRYGGVVVGFWHALNSTEGTGVKGIFSLTKVDTSERTEPHVAGH